MIKCKVYDGDLIGWCSCEIIKEISNSKRAIVKTSDGTVLTRILKEVNSESKIVSDGCVYKIKKSTNN